MPTLSELRATALEHRPAGFLPVKRVEIHDVTPNIRSKQLGFKGVVLGTKAYPILVVFNGIEYQDHPDREHPLQIDLKHGEKVYCSRPSMSKTPVQVRCQCPDFYFTWQFYDQKVKALAGGKFPKYVRKTTHYPERNPGHLPGYCKHLEGFISKLRLNQYISA